MNTHLLVHNIGFIISIIVTLGISFFIFFNNKRSIASIMLTLTMISIIIFIVSHLIGVNTSNPIVSRDIFMFNLSTIFIGVFFVHSTLAYLNISKKKWLLLTFLYLSTISVTIWLSLHPNLFLLPSVPKMYFPNYYVPGSLNWIRLVFLFVICIPYSCIELIKAYRNAQDKKTKQQHLYLILALVSTAIFGFIPNFLVYNIPVDPMWGMAFMIFFVSYFVYGSLKYELFNIRIIAKQAFVYSIGIVVVGGFIMLFDYINRIVRVAYPAFPDWVSPFASSILVITIAGIIWRKLRENDILKYEFVTTVTHKFRTPLTHIKWASENLSATISSPEDRVQLNYIQNADEKLVELTSLLMNISETENSDYEYVISHHSLSNTVNEVADSLAEQYEIKKLIIKKDIESDIYAEFDESRIKFIIQTFIENAVHYTPENGSITITLKHNGSNVVFSVKDSGIGISDDEINRLFKKFYRGHNARLTDTEGMGIGLYMSKEIINRHEGKIWASSEGTGLGSTFSFSLKKSK